MSQLPVHLSSFVGREREISAVRELLASSRLLTLTGAGGSGKTRLALEIARAAKPGGDGVAWVELTQVNDASLVAQRVRAELGIREEAGRSAETALIDVLRSRELLLVVDNCEHIVDAVAALTDKLLRNCPRLCVLATSREALGVEGEIVWLVPPLSLPHGSGLRAALRSEAVQLLAQRGAAVAPGFEITEANAGAAAEICRRLDGIPLAIELAAARLRVLSIDQIQERLDDSFRLLSSSARTALPRHRTLRAVIDWSYELLDADERILLQRLSVFSGTFDFDAVEAICAGGELGSNVLDPLAALADKSLVQLREHNGAARYRLLGTVRQYALEKLREGGGEEELRRAHLTHYAKLAETYFENLSKNPVLREWLDALEAEHDNMLGALEWSYSTPAETVRCFRLAGALWWFWFYSVQHWGEGTHWLQVVLDAHGPSASPELRARVLHGAGTLAYMEGDLARAEVILKDAAESAREAGNQIQLGLILGALAHVLGTAGADPDAALEMAQQALALTETSRNAWDPAFVLTVAVGFVQQRAGRLDDADRSYKRAHEYWQKLGSDWGLALILYARATLACARNDAQAALALHRESVPHVRRMRDPWTTARTIIGVADALSYIGDWKRVTELLAAASAIRDSVGAAVQPFERRLHDELLQTATTKLGRKGFDEAWREGLEFTSDTALELIESLAGSPAPQPRAAPIQVVVQDNVPVVQADVRVQALGSIEVWVRGNLLDPGVWTYTKPRELLVLLLRSPEGRTRDQIGAMLWPDASASQIRNSFHVTLHHLRKALGMPDAIRFDRERYRTDPGMIWQLDANEFERLVPAALSEKDTARRVTQLQAALALYKGDFMENAVVGEWHLEHRDRLMSICCDAWLALGEGLLELGRNAEAATAFMHAIAKNEFLEQAHRGLMTARARLGDRAAALRQYEKLTILLKEELDTEPDPATTALNARLREGQLA